MANRYWVGGSGQWTATGTDHWSISDGGSSGASAPVSGDRVIFTVNSGSNFIVEVANNIPSGIEFSFEGGANGTIDFATNNCSPNVRSSDFTAWDSTPKGIWFANNSTITIYHTNTEYWGWQPGSSTNIVGSPHVIYYLSDSYEVGGIFTGRITYSTRSGPGEPGQFGTRLGDVTIRQLGNFPRKPFSFDNDPNWTSGITDGDGSLSMGTLTIGENVAGVVFSSGYARDLKFSIKKIVANNCFIGTVHLTRHIKLEEDSFLNNVCIINLSVSGNGTIYATNSVSWGNNTGNIVITGPESPDSPKPIARAFA